MKSLYVSNDNQIFMSPDSALVSRGNPWFKPEDGDEWYGKLLVGTCITRLGMHISEKFAQRYYKSFIAAVHTFSPQADEALRWMRDGALVTGPGEVDAATDGELSIAFDAASLSVDAAALRAAINKAIAYASSYVTLKTGDLILLPVELTDKSLGEGYDFDVKIADTQMLHFKTR